MSATTLHKPWYRERWPWLLMLPPAASVVAGVALLYLAVRSPAALVVDDYSRIEEISREQSVEDRRAAELALAATIELRVGEAGATAIAVRLDGNAGSLPTLDLKLRHAGNEAADRTLALTRDGAEYVGQTDLAAGRYDFELSPTDRAWRLAGAVGRAPTTVRVVAE